jgi:hypothetical protein
LAGVVMNIAIMDGIRPVVMTTAVMTARFQAG